MEIKEVFSFLHEDMIKVEAEMAGNLSSEIPLINMVSNYLLSSGGKRFRPLILILCARLCGYDGERSYKLGSVIEYIHTATLLHDDVVDDATVRRGNPAANMLWGNKACILAGDYLVTKSFSLLSDDSDTTVIKIMSDTTTKMSEGEALQLLQVGNLDITEDDYIAIVERKTASLIGAACRVGGYIAGADFNLQEILANFGKNMGIAFQIVDDSLDYASEYEEFGKSLYKDLDEGKITLPLIQTIRKSNKDEREKINLILKNHQEKKDQFHEILSLMNKYEGIRYSLDSAKKYIEEGKSYLAQVPDRKEKAYLLKVADYVIERKS